MNQSWRLDTEHQTLVLGSFDSRLPVVAYWAGRLSDEENLELLCEAHQIDVTGGMLDKNPDLSICPEFNLNFPGQAGSIVRSNNGELISTSFVFQSVIETDNSLSLVFQAEDVELFYESNFYVFQDSNIIQSQCSLKSKEDIRVEWLAAPVMPASQASEDMIDFAGRWCGEFQEICNAWTPGIRCRENRTGRTGHEHFPGLIVPDRGATNTSGKVYGFHYGWSGGHKMIAEELPDGRRQIQFGHATGTETQKGKLFSSAPLYLTFSTQGINGVAKSFQTHLRKHIVNFPDQNRPRPVHYNCWESVYFDHNIDELQDIASKVAKLGAERFVLDDGWFGNRDNDTQSLGDWNINRKKYPNGLQPLIDHVHSEGMTFGIWFEPEMVNPNSLLYKMHPEWVLGANDQILGRHQKVLNMALNEVVDYLFDAISNILSEYDIDYVKWDHNRVLPVPEAAQTRGTYQLLDRIKKAFPNVEIESCASGGGRIDFGILSRTHRVWLSDSNDAIERAKIQHGAAIFLPSCITGSHIGPSKSHTSGRKLDIHFRAWIAAQRHMGFEMDPRELDTEDSRELKRICDWWKAERHWLMQSNIFRLESVDKSIIAEQHLADDESQFVIFINKIDTSNQISPRPVRAYGLEESAQYEIEFINRDEVHALSRGENRLKSGNLVFSGAYLMNYGLTFPWSFPSQVWVFKGKKI